MLDPTSVINAQRAPSAQFRGPPEHYNPPYAGPYGAGGYHVGSESNMPRFAPPSGPPPAHKTDYVPEYDAAKLPGYGEGDARSVDEHDVDKKDPFGDSDGPSQRV